MIELEADPVPITDIYPTPSKITITCGACQQEWTDTHRCSVPPRIAWSRYTDGALRRLADELVLILADRERRKEQP